MPLPIPAAAPNPLPLTINLTRPEGAVGLDSPLPGAVADAYGLHLTVPIAKPAPVPTRDFPRCEVKSVNGAPTILIDGQPTPPILWASSYGSLDRYLSYGASGIKLFRPYIDGAPIPAPGEEEETAAWWHAAVDHLLASAVAADPEVKLLPIITMDPHPQWLFDHPDEQMVSARGTIVIPLGLQVPDRGQVRPTFMSTAWRRDGAEGLQRLVTFLRGRPYAGNLIGIWFFAGRAGENYWGGNELNLFINEQGDYDAVPRERWDSGDFSMAARVVFRRWLKEKYGTDEALRRAWRRDDLGLDDILDPARFRREEIAGLLTGAVPAGAVRDPRQPGVGTLPMDYYQCMSEAMIDSFASWGKAVKEASDNRLLTGCYYSYGVAQLYTHVPGFFGHTAMAKATRTPYLDGYSSPSDYSYRRAGQEVFAYNVTDSLRLHNKLHFYEYDSRTHLANIEPKTYSEEETVEAWKRDVANALARQSAWWWYEFAEGQTGPNARPWFDDPAIRQVARRAKWAYEQSLKLPGRTPSAQIAVFYHGESIPAMDLFPPGQPINLGIIETLWHQLPRLGAPFDFYNLADLPALTERGLLRQYRLCLFLNPFYLTEQERGWVEACRGGGRTLAWLWGPGLARADGPRQGLDASNVAALTGLPGIRALDQRLEPTWRVTAQHALTAGLATGFELAPRPLSGMWGRFGNVIGPLLYVDPNADPQTQVLGRHVTDGQLRAELGAWAVRDGRRGGEGYASVYFAVPTVPAAILRNLARFAGVHLYRESDDLVYASAQFAAVHAGAQPITGPLRLPVPSPVYDVFAGKLIAERTDTIALDVKPKHTVLYLLARPEVEP
ncbi:MAG: hypothetical protein HUU35_14655 [Armatimonadetes bacterium]|nr:hypothetical protein [Armatimonadota bacterium]